MVAGVDAVGDVTTITDGSCGTCAQCGKLYHPYPLTSDDVHDDICRRCAGIARLADRLLPAMLAHALDTYGVDESVHDDVVARARELAVRAIESREGKGKKS